jgi:hypothetical protein
MLFLLDFFRVIPATGQAFQAARTGQGRTGFVRS